MNEYNIGYLAVGGLVGVVLSSLLYMLGGRGGIGKWVRRFVGSAILATTTITLLVLFGLFQWIHLCIYPLLVIGFSMGYGADELKMKLIRRTLYMLGVTSSGLLLAWTIGGNAWFVLILHVGVGAFSIFLGCKNFLHAAAEETIICALLNIGLVLYPFIS